jgi:chorismate--pyruvate lyase
LYQRHNGLLLVTEVFMPEVLELVKAGAIATLENRT